MINGIWCGLIVIGVIVSMFTGKIQAVTDSAISSAGTAVEISIGLVGVMALWLGLMKIAEEAGMVRAMGRAMKPLMIRLFPEVPADHPAMGSMVANMAANFFGLGNAATPLGIKAMQELQDLNTNKYFICNSYFFKCNSIQNGSRFSKRNRDYSTYNNSYNSFNSSRDNIL